MLLASSAVAAEPVALDESLHRLERLEAQVAELSRQQLSSDSFRETPSCCLPSVCSTVCAGWEASAEGLYLKMHQRGLDFASTEDGTNTILGRGEVHSLDYDRDAGFRTSIGYRTKANWAVRLQYTTFDTDGVAVAERPGGVGQLFATRSHPDGNEEADLATAASSFEYQTFDLLADRPVWDGPFAALSIFGGLRWIDMEQEHQFRYNGRDFVNGLILNHTEMDGIGLRLGGEGTWRMAGGFSAFGRLGTSIVYGQYETRITETNIGGSQQLVDMVDRFDQAIPGLEAALGISYTWNGWSVRTGYEVMHWFNLVDRAMYVDDIQEGTYAPYSQDVLLEGVFAQLIYRR